MLETAWNAARAWAAEARRQQTAARRQAQVTLCLAALAGLWALVRGFLAHGWSALVPQAVVAAWSRFWFAPCDPTVLGLPILGSISVINSFDRRPKHWFLSAKAFAAAVVMLVVVYGGLLLAFIGMHHKGA